MIECKPGQTDVPWVNNEAKDALIFWEVTIEEAWYDLSQARFEKVI